MTNIMHWYEGSIAEAVSLSKQRNTIFVVFVEGENDLSAEMALTIDETEVVSRLSNMDNFLAIKLKSGSANYLHFAQIYQFVPVPSLFFIGRNGTPLEVVCAGVQATNLATRIDRILMEHLKEKPSTAASSKSIEDHESMMAGETSSQSSDEVPSQPKTSLPGQAKVNSPAKVNFTVAMADATPTKTDATPAKTEAKANDSQAKLDCNPERLDCGHVRVGSTPVKIDGSQAKADCSQVKENLPASPEVGAISSEANKAETRKEPPDSENSGPPTKIQKTFHQITKSGKEYDVVCEDDMCTRIPKLKPGEPGPSHASVADEQSNRQQAMGGLSVTSIEEKMEKAKELIEARRREKAAKEKELEKQKELERRALGQGVTELKQWQAEQEFKQIQEERKREKMENNLARQRILEQIAQDRAERRAKELAPKPAPQPTAPAAPVALGDSGARARIQFKLPDGSMHTTHFEADNTLEHVQCYVAENLSLTTSSFSLWTAFPRRELTDGAASLRQLQLTPSAAVLVLPRRPTAVAAPSPTSLVLTVITFFSQIFTTFILEPSTQVLNWLWERFTAPPSNDGPTSDPIGGINPTQTGGVRRRGNIHRLGEDKARDDDNNTWNGNSTQQM